MSDSEVPAEVSEGEALLRLEAAVGRLLDDRLRVGQRLRLAEDRVRELEATLESLRRGEVDPVALRDRIGELDAENEDLRGRLRSGAEAVDRLLARLRFLEDQRGDRDPKGGTP